MERSQAQTPPPYSCVYLLLPPLCSDSSYEEDLSTSLAAEDNRPRILLMGTRRSGPNNSQQPSRAETRGTAAEPLRRGDASHNAYSLH